MRRFVWAILCIGWAAATVCGFARLWVYGNTPGTSGPTPLGWPAESRVPRAANTPQLVVLLHPHCSCSRATVGELARLMAQCDGKLAATALFVRAAGASDGWEQTDLWRSAAAIPGVMVMLDDAGGAEARRFGASTSGHALLYSEGGQLLFAGGITASRGHSGGNAGRFAIAALVVSPGATANANAIPASPVNTPVYGCPLFDHFQTCEKEEMATCHN